MKQYTLTLKFQVEDPENNKYIKNVKEMIADGTAITEMTFGDLTTTEVKLEEDEDNINETNS